MKLSFKVMQVYVEVQPQIVQKRIDEMSKTQQVNTKEVNTTTVGIDETAKVVDKSNLAHS